MIKASSSNKIHQMHQKLVLYSLKKHIMYLKNYVILFGHSGWRNVYQKFRRHIYWTLLAVYCSSIVRKFS